MAAPFVKNDQPTPDEHASDARVDHRTDDPLAPARGILVGLAISLASILILILVVWLVAPTPAWPRQGTAPHPIQAPDSLLRARAACPNGATQVACRTALRHAYEAVAWQRKANLELAREMLGKLTAWTCIHRGEGAWNDAGDPYWGGLQMDRPFMRTYGRDMLARHNGGLADTWTPREQIIVAQRAFSQNRGYNPWPQTSRQCGLR